MRETVTRPLSLNTLKKRIYVKFMKNSKPSILHILPGPIYSLSETITKKYDRLSDFSEGTVVSISDSHQEITAGAYKIICKKMGNRYGFLIKIKLLASALQQAHKLKAKKKLDIVVTYDPLKTGLIGLIIKKIYRCKLIIEVNGVYHSAVLQKNTNKQGTSLKRRFFPIISHITLKNADGIKLLFENQIDKGSLNSKTAIMSFFDYTQIPSSPYKNNTENIILSIGFPAHIKGMDILIEAFSMLTDEFPKWKLHLIGFFSTQEIQYLKLLSAGSKNIVIKKPVDFSAVPKTIDACNIFALPSRTEAMGRVLLEAMARSKARIATNVDGIPTVIEDGADGLLVEPESVKSLAYALKKLMENEPERQRLAEKANCRFKKEFTLDCYAEKTKSLYDKVLQHILPA